MILSLLKKKIFGLSKILFLITFLIPCSIGAPLSTVHLNQKLCSFKAGDYSLQWAYEPQSKNVVFVLKQKSELNNFWTGVGFGDRKKGLIDFVGVFVKNGQIGIADTHIIPEDGTLTPDPSTNVQSIAFDYHNKSVTAKFARALKSPDEKFDQNLDNCQIFNFAINGGSISRSGIVPDFDEIAEKRICDIDKNCIVDIRQHLKPSESSPESDSKLFGDKNSNIVDSKDIIIAEDDISSSSSTSLKSNKKIAIPEFAESVDISGTGDPCSFAGTGYTVNWTYSPETDTVDFSMKHPIRMGKWWSAVGIGDTMADMDIAIMFISSGRPKRIRDYFSKSYTVPEEDTQQDWILSRHRTKSVDEMIELGFSRKLETNDNKKDRSLDGCVLFQFAANAGHYGSGFAVRKHEEWPDLYKACDIKKHCAKTSKEESKSAEKEGEDEEISESNDAADDVIDEADDDEIVSLKKRTETKIKAESRRQLESSQVENEDGTSTTNLVIPLSGATFSTLNPSDEDGTTEAAASEEDGAATTMASGEVVEGLVVTTVASSEVENAEAGATTLASGESIENAEANEATTLASSGETNSDASAVPSLSRDGNLEAATTVSSGEEIPTTVSGETVAGFQAVENGATELPNTSAENGTASSLGSEVANNEVGATTISPEVTTVESTTETTTPGANVTQQPVHIIPMINGELNTTMYIPGSEKFRIPPEEGESSLGGNFEIGNNTLEDGAVTPTTSEPAFGIQSTLQERPTTLSSGESDVTETSKLSGEDNSESEGGAVTDTSRISGTFEGTQSTGLRPILPVTVSLNNNVKTTVSPESEESETTDENGSLVTEGSLSVGKNQVETITVPSEVKEKVAEAGKALTNFANTLNNTEIEVGGEGTTVASDSEATEVGSNNIGGAGEEGITTPGEVEIVPENAGEGGETTPEGESAVKIGADSADSTTISPEGNEGAETATTISDGKKGNKGKGKNNKGGKNSETLKDPIGSQIGEDDATTVSSEVTTASGVENSEVTTTDDDSDLTAKQPNGTDATSEGTVTVSTENTSVTSESAITGEEEATTAASSETTEASGTQGVTSIDSDANGSTVAIGTLPEIGSTDETTKTTVPGLIVATTNGVKQLVTGGDSNEAGDTTENLLEVLATTTGKLGQGLRDSAVTEASTTVPTSKVTSPLPNNTPRVEVSTQPSKESSEVVSEVEGSGEASVTSSTLTMSTASNAQTTPIPGPFEQHKQQLINELGKEAVGNPKEGCGENHEDYSQCTVYFKNYLARVQAWADENHERMEDQYGKACTLLSQVQNVTTLCCSIFVETCKGKIEF